MQSYKINSGADLLRRSERKYKGERTIRAQVLDYAYYTNHPFSYRDIVNDLGLPKREVGKQMKLLREAGEIVLVSAPRFGMYLHVSRAPKTRLKEGTIQPDMSNEAAVKEKILASMHPDIVYSSRALREVAEMPTVPFLVFAELAAEGKIEKISKPRSYYWIKRSSHA